MKGLLRKDLYMLRSYYLKFVLIMILFLGIFVVGNEDVSFYLVFPFLFAGIMPSSLLAYDEREKWDVCASALPIGRAQLVTVKYLLVLILLVPVGLLALLAAMIKNPASLDLSLNTISAGIAIGMLSPAVVLPFSFALGAEKGRLAYYCFIGLFVTLGSLYAKRISGAALSVPAFLSFPAALPLLALLLLVLSWRIAIVLYRKREL